MIALLVAALLVATPCPEATVVKAGQPAACSGTVLPRADIVMAAKCLKGSLLSECQASAKRDRQAAAARHRDLRRQVAAEKARGDLLDKRLAEVAAIAPPTRDWWEHPALWGAVGLAVGIGATVGIYQLLR